MNITIKRFSDGQDFETQRAVADLYDGVFDFVPLLHQVLVGNGLMHLFLAFDGQDLVGAAVLKSSEVVMPIGSEIQPLAWAISDVVTAERHQRKGVALRLVRHLEGEVQRVGGRIVYLYTDVENEAAIRLYVKAGFRRLRPQGRQVVFAKLIEG